jgi:hypothetical protein
MVGQNDQETKVSGCKRPSNDAVDETNKANKTTKDSTVHGLIRFLQRDSLSIYLEYIVTPLQRRI